MEIEHALKKSDGSGWVGSGPTAACYILGEQTPEMYQREGVMGTQTQRYDGRDFFFFFLNKHEIAYGVHW